jgi:hypothetical protein
VNGSLMTPDDPSFPAPAGETSVEYFLNCPTGVVEYYFESPALRWSDELYRIHGYERGEIVPTLDLGISHFVPTDRDAARSLWDTLLSQGGPASAYFSLRDVKGKVRKVLISGDYIRHDHEGSSEPVGVWALVVDLTRSVHADTARIANDAVAALAVNRAVIEQAKGTLMGAGGLSADDAFEVISRRSQITNRKTIAVSQSIIDLATRRDPHDPDRSRAHLLSDFIHPPLKGSP